MGPTHLPVTQGRVPCCAAASAVGLLVLTSVVAAEWGMVEKERWSHSGT